MVSGNQGRGVEVNADGFALVNSWVGLSPDGISPMPNKLGGVSILSSVRQMARIGAAGGGGRVIISGNGGSGLVSRSARVTVANTWLGLAADGSTSVGNLEHGLKIDALPRPCYFDLSCAGPGSAATNANVQIGLPGAGNMVVVSGNGEEGIHIDERSAGTAVVNALVGVTADGAASAPNRLDGIVIAAADCWVGMAALDARVIVSGNGGSGIVLRAERACVVNAFVGLSPAGGGAFGNGLGGIMIIETAVNSTVGQPGGAEGRVLVSGNLGNGVLAMAAGLSLVNTYVCFAHL